MKDSFYTPIELADTLVNYVDKKIVKNVADFCVGDGVLLRAALNKWPDINCFGVDISGVAISSLERLHPDWSLTVCDFLDSSIRKSCIPANSSTSTFDLILLNPPFSCIGGSRHKIELDGFYFEVSTAMTFLVESIKYLSTDGCLYAILPSSAAYSQKDSTIWRYLVENYNLSILDEPKKNQFKGCSPTIILVSIKSEFTTTKIQIQPDFNFQIKGLSLFRGKLGMHKVSKYPNKGNLLVHSTNLRNNKLVNLCVRVEHKFSEIKGPAVLIPRVGLPNCSKICTIKKNEKYTLSDCVIAIKTKSEADCFLLKNKIIENWSSLNDLYKGTGARYITLEKIKKLLKI